VFPYLVESVFTGVGAKPIPSGYNLLLTKSEICANDILIDGIDAPGRRPGEERPRLFDIVGGDRNLSASRSCEADFFISIAHNPLKSPDSGK